MMLVTSLECLNQSWNWSRVQLSIGTRRASLYPFPTPLLHSVPYGTPQLAAPRLDPRLVIPFSLFLFLLRL